MAYDSSYGSDILATGEARLISESDPEAKVAFGNPDALSQNAKGKTKLYWSEIFENNPHILQPGEDAEKLIIAPNYPKSRPFIDYRKTKYNFADEQNKSPYKIAYDPDYEATRGELYFTDQEIEEAEKLVKDLNTPIVFLDAFDTIANKLWPIERWEELVKSAPYNFVHLTYDERMETIAGAKHINADTFRQACAVLKLSVGNGILLGIDSHLHHAAAAVNLPAAVIWSHYSHPDNLGYPDHINVRWDAAGKPCGLRDQCIQCKHSMEMIKVEDAMHAIELAFKHIK
ncbi:MAG: hypothetical protein ACO3MW_08260 [Rhodospirillales bacterium]